MNFQTQHNPCCEMHSRSLLLIFFSFVKLEQTNNVVFSAIALVPAWFPSLITHRGSVYFHTNTQGLWPIITTYYSGKWILHICFQWMARLTLLLAYSILLHKPLANRCLCWSEWTFKLRPTAALWQQVKFARQPPRGRLSPTLFMIVRSLPLGLLSTLVQSQRNSRTSWCDVKYKKRCY